MSEEALESGIVDWVIDHPESVAVFERLGIDYCCGGKSLEYACLQAGANPASVLAELRQATAAAQKATEKDNAAPPTCAESKPPCQEPLTDSPLFWLGLFGLAAFIALAAIGPKFAKRQQRLQLQSNTREQIWRDQLQPSDAAANPSPKDAGSLPLWPLSILGLTVAGGSWGWLWRQRRAMCQISLTDAKT